MQFRLALTAAILGAAVAFLALYAFGLWVAFHPFGRAAQRTAWLVPLLHVLSWFPFVVLGTIPSFRLLRAHPISGGFVAALVAVSTVVAFSLYCAPAESLMDAISLMWLHLLCPLALFPAFCWLLANLPLQRAVFGVR
jgi:hypothetical protein